MLHNHNELLKTSYNSQWNLIKKVILHITSANPEFKVVKDGNRNAFLGKL